MHGFKNFCEFWINPLLLCETASNLVLMFIEKTCSQGKFCVSQDCPYPLKYEDGKLKVCVGSLKLLSFFDRWLPCGFSFINNLSYIFKSATLFSLLLLSKLEKASCHPPYRLNSLPANLSPFTLGAEIVLKLKRLSSSLMFIFWDIHSEKSSPLSALVLLG